MFSRQHVAALTGEFVGTTILAFALLALINSQLAIPYFISIAMGVVLALLVAVFYSICGVVFNPAMTVGLWTIRKLSTVKAVTYIVAQVLGGFAAFGLFGYLTGHETWANHAPEFEPKMFVAETLGATVFALGIAAAVTNKLTVGAKAAIIGAALTVGILLASVAAPGYLNPSVALANQFVNLVSVGAPILGAIIGFNLYVLLFDASNMPVVAVKRAAVSAPVAAKTTKSAAKVKRTAKK